MRNLLLWSVLCLVLVLGMFFLVKANNQEDGGVVVLPLQKAIIYPKKSHFFHQFSVNLRKGDTILYLQNIAKGIDTNTLSLKGFAENTTFTLQYAKNQKSFPKNHLIYALKDSVFFLKDTLENIFFAQNALEKSQNALKTNAVSSLEHFSKEKMQELYTFLYQKDIENQKQKRNLLRTHTHLKEKLAKIEDKIAFYESQNAEKSPVLMLKVRLKEDFLGELNLAYFTPQMYWTPYYKINVLDKDSLVKMDFLGKITQKSEVVFQKTATILATKPFLKTDFSKEKTISLMADSIFQKRQKNTSKNLSNITETADFEQFPAWKHELSLTISPKMDTNFVFFSKSTKKKYILYSQPSQELRIYKAIKWENWAFEGALPAQAEVWVDNQKTETMFLSPQNANLYLKIAQDERIKADYKPFLMKGMPKTDQKNDSISYNTQGFDAQIHNHSKDTLQIEVLENLPIVQHEYLKMDLSQTQKNPNFIPEQHIFLWNITLKPNEKRELQANWILSFPKNFELIAQ